MSDSENTEKTYDQRVNDAVSAMTQGEDGKWLPVETDDEGFRFAVTAERRRRDTQAAFTRTQQENARLKAEANHLAEGWQKDFASQLTPTIQAELEELKITDPDAWRNRLNQLEAERTAKFNETRTAIANKAKGESELEYRTRTLEEYNTANPDHALTQDVIDNDLPPRFLKELEKGDINWSEFMAKASDYLHKGKVVKPREDKPTPSTNLTRATGSAEPSDEAVRQQLATSYDDEIY